MDEAKAIENCVRIFNVKSLCTTIQNRIGFCQGKLLKQGFNKQQADNIIQQALDKAN